MSHKYWFSWRGPIHVLVHAAGSAASHSSLCVTSSQWANCVHAGKSTLARSSEQFALFTLPVFIYSKYKISAFFNAPPRRKHHIFAVWEEGGSRDFCRWVNEVFALLGRYTANICNHLPTPLVNLSVPFLKNGLREPWKWDRQVVSRCR